MTTGSPLKVLVVEDEGLVALMLEDMIEALGHQVAAVAATLEEAIALTDRGQFDVALLDMNLRGVSSEKVAERLRELRKPFIFATGYGDKLVEGSADGVPVLAKPFEGLALEQAIAKAMRAHTRSRS